MAESSGTSGIAGDLTIAEAIKAGQGQQAIVSSLHVSPKRVVSVRKLIEAGEITFDASGKASYAPNHTTSKDFSDYAYRAARILGVEDPEEALKKLLGFAVKLNPYIIHFGVNTPEGLIAHLEGQVDELRNKVKRLSSMDENGHAECLGLNKDIFELYNWVINKGYSGSLADFLNDTVADFFKDLGIEVRVREKRTILGIDIC